MQRYTVVFIIVNALTCFWRFLRPSSGAQELYTQLATTASGSSKQAWYIPDAVCTVLELLMMGGETARNM